jgi:aminoglycoside phosphotransferase (APT) family kinase protein
MWAAMIALAEGPRPRVRQRFIHRDYHPMNVRWSRGRLSGVVDWTNASVGPTGNDVAWCRQNLVASAPARASARSRRRRRRR